MERASHPTPERQSSPSDASERERHQELARRHERTDTEAEKHKQQETLHHARQEVSETAQPAEHAAGHHEREQQPASEHHGTLKARSYKKTMAGVRRQLSRPQRLLSRVVHAPAIDSASELAGRTILRPMPLLGAGVVATLITGFVYFYARSRGYGVSGSGWFLMSFGVGYCIGLLIDMVRLGVLRRRAR